MHYPTKKISSGKLFLFFDMSIPKMKITKKNQGLKKNYQQIMLVHNKLKLSRSFN